MSTQGPWVTKDHLSGVRSLQGIHTLCVTQTEASCQSHLTSTDRDSMPIKAMLAGLKKINENQIAQDAKDEMIIPNRMLGL